MTDDKDDRLVPEKTVEWLQDEALKRCQRRLGCRDLKAVIIGRTKPRGSGPNWEVLAFLPELSPAAEHEAMEEIHRLRGIYALKTK